MADLISELIHLHYGMEILEKKKLTVGAGSNTYFINTKCGKFILKNANINEANNPQNEPDLCEHLLQKGLPVSEFTKDNNGDFLWSHDNEIYHMQKFVDGVTLEWNTAQDWLLDEAAQTLAEIHMALQDYPTLPIGIGENFFKYMTPETAMEAYENSYKHAVDINDLDSAKDLNFRLELMKRISIPAIQLDKLTRKNTHGDYFISQLICADNKINAVIDWTTACVHPVVWEIMRSYVYAAPECREGEINVNKLVRYVGEYKKIAPLNEYDVKMIPYVFFYQISVCDYYNQYYQSTADNREIYLQQAILSTKIMKWFDKNADEISAILVKELCD